MQRIELIAYRKACRAEALSVARRARTQHQALNAFISEINLESIAVDALPGKEDFWRHLTRGQSSKLQSCAVKDNIATSYLRTTCASAILQNHQSPFNASVVDLLSGPEGPTVTGKTNMDEFGMGSHSLNSFFGPVTAPARPTVLGLRKSRHDFSVGGSSGGSAVAVETAQSHIALGTDTGGSVRLPAAYTGTVGFKPSYGLISRWGVVPYANSLDTVGILATSASQAKYVFFGLSGHDPLDPTSLTKGSLQRMAHRKLEIGYRSGKDISKHLSSLKIGVPSEYNIEELDPGIRAAWQNVLKILQEQGCTVVPISLPTTKHALSAYYVLAAAEAMSNLAKYDGVRYGTRSGNSDGAGDVLYSQTRGDGFGDEVKRRILLGSYTLSSEAIDNYFIKAQRIRRLVQRDFDRVFTLPNLLRPAEQFDLSDMEESIELDTKLGPSQVDFIICPTAPTLPPTHADIKSQTPVNTYMNDVFTVPASLAGLPAISIPVRIPPEHIQCENQPTTLDLAGLQIIGQYSDDYRVLNAAGALEMLLAKHHLGSDRTPAAPEQVLKRQAKKLLRISKFHGKRIRKIASRSDRTYMIKRHVASGRVRRNLVFPEVRKVVACDRPAPPAPLTEQEISAELDKTFLRWEQMQSSSNHLEAEESPTTSQSGTTAKPDDSSKAR